MTTQIKYLLPTALTFMFFGAIRALWFIAGAE